MGTTVEGMREPRRVSSYVMGRLQEVDPSRKIVAMKNDEGRYGFQHYNHVTGEVVQAGIDSRSFQHASRQSMGWRTPLRATIAALAFNELAD